MVSIGTAFGLLLAGGAALVGYGLYQNRDAIGSALARGTEVNITNPIGDWFENLFRSNENDGSGNQGNNQGQNPPLNDGNFNNDYVPCSNNPADSRTWCEGYTPPPEQDFLPRNSDTSAVRLSNFQESGRSTILDRAEAIAAERGINEGNAIDTAILESISYPGEAEQNRFYDVVQNGETVFNEYPLSPEAVDYYKEAGYSVRTADGV